MPPSSISAPHESEGLRIFVEWDLTVWAGEFCETHSADTLCGPNQVSHFLCDIPLLLKLSCSDTSLSGSVFHMASTTTGLSSCLFTAVTYMLIISDILSIPSAQGRSKAFSNCASHLPVFGTANLNYNRPSISYILDILVSVPFCVVTPMFNPVIYSLRKKEIKGVLRKWMEKVNSLVISVNRSIFFILENFFLSFLFLFFQLITFICMITF